MENSNMLRINRKLKEYHEAVLMLSKLEDDLLKEADTCLFEGKPKMKKALDAIKTTNFLVQVDDKDVMS